MNRKHHLLAATLLLAAATLARADVVTDWNELLERSIKTNALSAAIQARTAAITHVAMYDAVNGIARQYAPYFVHEAAPAGASPEAAAAQAAYSTLKRLFPNLTTNFDAALTTSLTQITNSGAPGSAIARGLSWGQSVATRVIAWRAQDGFTNAAPGYFGGTNIGQWRSVPTPTAPDGTLSAIFPQLATLVPFAMTHHAQFRPGPPYGLPLAQALASPQYAVDLNEVKAIGRIDSPTRTAEQTSLARLWQASSTAELNNCLRQVLPGANSLVENARLFALANIVAADALIVGFDSKYTYNFWRPHHAIRFADLDDNAATDADPAWNALIIAPRHQEYISNHAVHSGGLAYALARLLGDAHTFTLGSVDFPGFTWTFHSWSEMGVQVKEARIWGGIHYRNSCDAGEAAGRNLADYVLDNFLGLATPLAITQQPQDQTAIAGGSATYTVAATGTSPLTYQWRRHTNSTAYSEIPGATGATFVLTDVQSTSHRFCVVVTDGFGLSVTSSLARLLVFFPPTINNQPSSHAAVAGESDTLSVLAGGTPPLAYQWYFNGMPLNRATSTKVTFASLQPSNAGNYQIIITNLYGAATSLVATLAVVPGATFARVTNGPIATDKGSFTRCVWGDFNNDGFLDLFVNDYGGPNVFYRNNGDRTFTKLTEIGLAATADFHTGTAAADYDNDGYLDLIDLAGIQAPTPRFNTLYHNDGTRRFTPVSAGGVTNLPGFFDAVAWADYDNDGFVDLFITENGTSTDTGGTNRLWHNNGDGTFTEITAGPFATDVGVGWATLWSDYDNDGFMDLIVLNLSNDSTNFLYHNNGNGTFSRVLTNAIATDHWITGAEAGAWGDFDNDGWPDLFVTDNRGARNRLYHNNGDGSFSNVAAGPMLTPPAGTSPRGCTWGDYDNDGFIDLFVTDANSRNRLYHNNGDGTFGEITTGPQVNDPALSGFSGSCAWADFDNDGFLDLFVTLGASSRNVSNALYHNSGNSNAWLEIKCVGTVANRSAIGTKVRLVTTIAGKSVSQLREINTGGGWNSVPLIAHFGLGDATKVETLRLEWPSGTVQELHNVAPRQILTLTEPPRLTATKVSGQPQFTLKGGRNMTYDIEASSNPTTWAALSTVTITNLSGTALITDPAGTVAKHKFYRAVTR